MSHLKMDGYDDCVIGLFHRFGMESVIAYDYDKVIDKMVSQGMTPEEAVEFHEFNQLGAWVGERTPGFVQCMTLEEIGELDDEEEPC